MGSGASGTAGAPARRTKTPRPGDADFLCSERIPSMKRWHVAAAGFTALLLAGMVYAWSILSAPIAQEFPHWSKAQLSMTFTVVMIFFCLGSVAAGFLSARVSARTWSVP